MVGEETTRVFTNVSEQTNPERVGPVRPGCRLALMTSAIGLPTLRLFAEALALNVGLKSLSVYNN